MPQCQYVSPANGPCQHRAKPASALCALHACPVCGGEKPSAAATCEEHLQETQLATATTCSHVSVAHGHCKLRAVDDKPYCQLHMCPSCGREKESSMAGCALHRDLPEVMGAGAFLSRSSRATSADRAALLGKAKAGLWLEVEERLLRDRALSRSADDTFTLLHYAVLSRLPFAIAMVLHYGARIDTPTKAADTLHQIPAASTPLHLALLLRDRECTALLLCCGASVALPDGEGRLPAAVPSTAGCTALVGSELLATDMATVQAMASRREFAQLAAFVKEHNLPLDVKSELHGDLYLIHEAAFDDSLEAYRALVDAGASPLMRTVTENLLPSALARRRGADPAAREMELQEQSARRKLSTPVPLAKAQSEVSSGTVFFSIKR